MGASARRKDFFEAAFLIVLDRSEFVKSDHYATH